MYFVDTDWLRLHKIHVFSVSSVWAQEPQRAHTDGATSGKSLDPLLIYMTAWALEMFGLLMCIFVFVGQMHMEEPCFDFLRTKETLGSAKIYLFVYYCDFSISLTVLEWLLLIEMVGCSFYPTPQVSGIPHLQKHLRCPWLLSYCRVTGNQVQVRSWLPFIEEFLCPSWPKLSSTHLLSIVSFTWFSQHWLCGE